MSQKEKKYDLIEFSNQAKFFIEKYFKVTLTFFIIAIACSAAWVGVKKVEAQKEQDAFASLFAITKEYTDKKEGFDKAEAQEKDKTKAKPEDDKSDKVAKEKFVKASGDLDKDYGEIVKKLEAFLSSHKGVQASGEAALTLTEIYENHGKKDKAAETLSQTLKSWKGKGLLVDIMRMRMGDLWSMNEKCEQAVSHWKILANQDSFLTPQAQLKLGLCFQKLGKIDQAKLWLQKITSKNAESPAGFSAKKYLRFLNFEKNLKKEGPTEKTATESDKSKEKAS